MALDIVEQVLTYYYETPNLHVYEKDCIDHAIQAYGRIKQIKHPDRYYIYQGYAGGDLVYIGKGSGDRYKHLTSGTSSSIKANEAFFKKVYVYTEIIATGLTEENALLIEKLLIKQHKPLWNKQGK